MLWAGRDIKDTWRERNRFTSCIRRINTERTSAFECLTLTAKSATGTYRNGTRNARELTSHFSDGDRKLNRFGSEDNSAPLQIYWGYWLWILICFCGADVVYVSQKKKKKSFSSLRRRQMWGSSASGSINRRGMSLLNTHLKFKNVAFINKFL